MGEGRGLRTDQAGYQVLSVWVTPYHRWLKVACHHGRLTDFTLALMVAGPDQPLGTEVTEARALQTGEDAGTEMRWGVSPCLWALLWTSRVGGGSQSFNG